MVVAAVVSFIATWIGASDNAIRLLLSLFAGKEHLCEER